MGRGGVVGEGLPGRSNLPVSQLQAISTGHGVYKAMDGGREIKDEGSIAPLLIVALPSLTLAGEGTAALVQSVKKL
ncbi:hypothetical protein NL676_000584 [Syzygium grande]|nr:hypothetical protein NL676_000584 [Syzygium grande]